MPQATGSIQFAVGGRTLPPLDIWIKITERFRGRTVRILCERLTGRAGATYRDLAPGQRGEISNITGKDEQGQVRKGHTHAHFLLWPDEHGFPARLMAWSPSRPFGEQEAEALLAASVQPIFWSDDAEFPLYLVPLPLECPLPSSLTRLSRYWHSVTPFVVPPARHRFRSQGRPRPGEAPEQVARKLLVASGLPGPRNISVLPSGGPCEVRVHETRQSRLARKGEQGSRVFSGFRMLIEFDDPVPGPIAIGDSCHFGLGLFQAGGGEA